jgi:hypothetical protein
MIHKSARTIGLFCVEIQICSENADNLPAQFFHNRAIMSSLTSTVHAICTVHGIFYAILSST